MSLESDDPIPFSTSNKAIADAAKALAADSKYQMLNAAISAASAASLTSSSLAEIDESTANFNTAVDKERQYIDEFCDKNQHHVPTEERILIRRALNISAGMESLTREQLQEKWANLYEDRGIDPRMLPLPRPRITIPEPELEWEDIRKKPKTAPEDKLEKDLKDPKERGKVALNDVTPTYDYSPPQNFGGSSSKGSPNLA